MEQERRFTAFEQIQADEVYGLKPELVRAIAEALEDGRLDDVHTLAVPLHYSDAADLIEHLDFEKRRLLVEVLRPDFNPDILIELDESVRDEVIEQLGFASLPTMVAQLDSDNAVYLLDQLDQNEQRRVLDALPEETRTIIEQGLAFPEYSAGRLMQREVVAMPAYWTVGEAIDHLREARKLPEQFYDIFVVDPRHRPAGRVSLARLLRSKRPVRLRDIVAEDLYPVPVTMDQEEVAFLFRQHNLVSAPVVDAAGRFVGTITVDDVVDVIDEEAEHDMMSLAGVGDSDVHLPTMGTAWRRIRWLGISLVNALLASFVIAQFEATIEEVVALAVLMPIVAAMGGNAGMQVVTVMVRALATKDIGPANTLRIVGKELVVGGLNGLILALVLGGIATVWFADYQLGAVLGAAMVFNMLWAGLAGAVIPLTLARVGVDPALAAAPFLLTTTDVLGFFAFLGLATIFLI